MTQDLCPFCEEEIVRHTSTVMWDPVKGYLNPYLEVYHLNCHPCDWGFMSTNKDDVDAMVEMMQRSIPCRL